MCRFLALLLALATALPAQANSHWPQPTDTIIPTTEGLLRLNAEGVPHDPMLFGTGFEAVMHTLIPVFGWDAPYEISFPSECGAGPMVSVHFPGRIQLMFQDDVLAGWMLIRDAGLVTDTGFAVGSPISALSAEGPVSTFETGLGTEFQAGETYGLLTEDGTRVEGLWTGTTCIFR
ncbi:hypothetical protein [Gymnodinialimonas ulvae]|uniref:hypothetical protein n=1 Tax=Gymnodinialimonas ulvae TaxID=3126504 RepID=UPI0030A54F99